MRSCRTGQGPWRVAEPGCLVVTGNLAGGLGRGLMHHGAGFCTTTREEKERAYLVEAARRAAPPPGPAPRRAGGEREGVESAPPLAVGPRTRRRPAPPPGPTPGRHAGEGEGTRRWLATAPLRPRAPPACAASACAPLALPPPARAGHPARRPPRSPGAAAIRCVRGRVTRGVGAGRVCGEARVSALFISRGCNESRWILNRWPAIMG